VLKLKVIRTLLEAPDFSRPEQLRQKPHVAADPTPCEAEDPVVVVFRYPQTVGVVA
jgi:hypothetical protein